MPGNYFSERYYRPEGSLHPWRNCKHGSGCFGALNPLKSSLHLLFSKCRLLLAKSELWLSLAHSQVPSPRNTFTSPPSAYCNTSRLACNSYSTSLPSTSRSAVCNLPVICGYGRAWRCLCGVHVTQRLPENRFTDFQAASRLSRFQAFAIVGFQTTPHNRWQATATRLPAK